MRNVISYLFLILFVSCNAICQEKWDKKLYEKYDYKNFRDVKLFHQEINFNDIDIPLIDAAIFYITNEIRAKKKLNTLSYHNLLEQSATMQSEDMLRYNFFSHYNPVDINKKTPDDRARIVGIDNPFLSENIATAFGLQYEGNTLVYEPDVGKFSYEKDGELIQPHTYISLAETLLDNWMNSKGHRENILSKDALQLGCGVVLYFDNEFNAMPTFKATQNFQCFENVRIK